jgi:hypothetical protein
MRRSKILQVKTLMIIINYVYGFRFSKEDEEM